MSAPTAGYSRAKPRRTAVTRGAAAPDSSALARLLGECAREKKGQEVVLLDLRGISAEADFFVVLSALSEPHQRALADFLLEKAALAGRRHWHLEGYPSSGWILLDYVDVVVHIFRPEWRDFYALESLWGDAPCERLGSDES